MKQTTLTKAKNGASKLFHLKGSEHLVVKSRGKNVYVLVTMIPFENEDDLVEYRLENDERFIRRVAASRANIKAGHGIRMEDLEASFEAESGSQKRKHIKR